MEELNKRFNDIVKSLPQDVKTPKNSLLIYYVDAYGVDTSYELRCTKSNDLKVTQTLVEKLEKGKIASGKSYISGFDRGP